MKRSSLVTYFAYASNLSIDQMAHRCPSARPLHRATLPDHRLDFPRLSKGWNGGVAGIVPEARSRVEGVVYGLSREDLAKLDILEGVPKSRYVRCRVEVVTAGGAPEQVWTYFAVPEDGWPFRPSRRYLETILTGAREHRLSSAYVDYLEKLSAESVASPT